MSITDKIVLEIDDGLWISTSDYITPPFCRQWIYIHLNCSIIAIENYKGSKEL